MMEPIEENTRMMTMKKTLIVTAAALLVAGCGATAPQETQPEPQTVTVTQTQDPRPAETVTVTPEPQPAQTVAQVPQACLDALDAADDVHVVAGEAFSNSGEAMMAASAGFNAIVEGDIDALYDVSDRMEAVNAAMDELSPRMDAVKAEYEAKAQECREAR